MNQKKKTTIHDIALKLDITASTVSRALSNHPRISDATKKMVSKMAKQLNYQPNNIASALRSGKSRLLGVIVPTANRAFFSSVVRGIEELANQLNYKVIICQSYESLEKEIQTVDALLGARVDGIIASIGKSTQNFDHFRSVMDKGIPLILFDRTTNELDVSQVVIDDYLGAYLSTAHLISEGYKRIAHLTHPKNVSIYRERLRGYLEALKDHHIEMEEDLIVKCDLQLEDGRHSIQHLLEKQIPFDAVFSASDYAAMGAMQVLKEHGIKIPEEVGLAGFGNEPFTSFTDPTLTSVDQISITMGKKAAEAFFDALKSDNKILIPQKTVLKPELIIRQSSLRSKPKSN